MTNQKLFLFSMYALVPVRDPSDAEKVLHKQFDWTHIVRAESMKEAISFFKSDMFDSGEHDARFVEHAIVLELPNASGEVSGCVDFRDLDQMVLVSDKSINLLVEDMQIPFNCIQDEV
jgi:hypothetical protein